VDFDIPTWEMAFHEIQSDRFAASARALEPQPLRAIRASNYNKLMLCKCRLRIVSRINQNGAFERLASPPPRSKKRAERQNNLVERLSHGPLGSIFTVNHKGR
jgi:hypothetical protein